MAKEKNGEDKSGLVSEAAAKNLTYIDLDLLINVYMKTVIGNINTPKVNAICKNVLSGESLTVLVIKTS